MEVNKKQNSTGSQSTDYVSLSISSDQELKNLIVQLREGQIHDENAFLDSFKGAIGEAAYEKIRLLFLGYYGNDQLDVNDNLIENYGRFNVVRGTWNQADSEVFLSEFAGKQCCAMALAFVVKSAIKPPFEWTSSTIDQILIEGNSIYKTLQLIIGDEIPASGFLYLTNFDVVKDELRMFDENFKIRYNDFPLFYGNLLDSENQEIGVNLLTALTKLFEDHRAGMLITGHRSFAVISSCGKFYFCDSHNCGPMGEPHDVDGRSCVIECDNIETLLKICKRTTGCGNAQFTLDYVDVIHLEDEYDCIIIDD